MIFVFANQDQRSVSGPVSPDVPGSAVLMVRRQLDPICHRAVKQAGIDQHVAGRAVKRRALRTLGRCRAWQGEQQERHVSD